MQSTKQTNLLVPILLVKLALRNVSSIVVVVIVILRGNGGFLLLVGVTIT